MNTRPCRCHGPGKIETQLGCQQIPIIGGRSIQSNVWLSLSIIQIFVNSSSQPKIIITLSFFVSHEWRPGRWVSEDNGDAVTAPLVVPIVRWTCHYREPPQLCPMARAVVPQGVERWGPFEDPGLQRWYAQWTKGGESPHLSILALILRPQRNVRERTTNVGSSAATLGGRVRKKVVVFIGAARTGVDFHAFSKGRKRWICGPRTCSMARLP
jgi:hypothetical protein